MRGYPPISEDLSVLLSLLNSHGVEFIVVGAHALAFHGVPRFTEDIDFFVAKSKQNIDRLSQALQDFGVTVPECSREEMVSRDRGVIFIGHKPNRADFLNFLDGVEFASAAESKVPGILADQPVNFISLEDYVATKKASGRPKDKGDLAMLKTTHPQIEV
jgi:predicted nucleotidyltransferase